MLTLINGDGNPRVTAAQDADWYGSLTGEKTCIMPANDKFSATVADANTIEISSGVLITKEGRRVQIDAETIEEIIIPTGTQGSDTYYIIGFHLYIDESGQQVAETFVETMENESDTITETTFREGSTSIYISLYRVKRSGLTLESVTRICPMYELSADEIVYGNTNVGSALTQINSDLSDYTKDFETLSELVAFTNFDIALPQDITTGSKVRILIHESSVDVWFTKELIVGVDIFLNQPAKRIFNVGGYYINPNSCGSCFVQTTANGRLQYNSIQLNGVDKSATTTIACVLFRA